MSAPLTPKMVRHLKAVADPTLAADASRVAFTYSWVDEETSAKPLPDTDA